LAFTLGLSPDSHTEMVYIWAFPKILSFSLKISIILKEKLRISGGAKIQIGEIKKRTE
jgi:hypothetical protein